MSTQYSTPAEVRKRGWVSLTYPYKANEDAMLDAAVRQLGSKPNVVLTVPGGREIFVPGKTNRGLR
jgi:hypothetical protein